MSFAIMNSPKFKHVEIKLACYGDATQKWKNRNSTHINKDRVIHIEKATKHMPYNYIRMIELSVTRSIVFE